MEIGKLDNDLLKRIVLDQLGNRRDEVLRRPSVGEDCAVLDFGAYTCVLSTDPITAAIGKIGSLAVHVSCNDVASDGVEPLAIMLTVLLPPETTERDIALLIAQAAAAANEIGVEIVGGHTEITDAVKQPIISATSIGRGLRSDLDAKAQAAPGDVLLVTKTLATEGTGVLATDHADRLQSVLTEEELKEATAMLNDVSVVKEGVAAGRVGTTAMHDVTEGGILGAVWEICESAGLGAEISEERLPVAGVTAKICDFFQINPLRLISSGSMLIAAHPERARQIEDAVSAAGVPITRIGTMKDKEFGIYITSATGESKEIDPPGSDEIYRV
jgi:hydrogenase expression/formation protein HypE